MGVKQVGTASKVSEADVRTLIVTMDMPSSQLVPPLIIYEGQFGGKLMKNWENYSRANVYFTEKN